MNELLLKYNKLDEASKIVALNFIDYLFNNKANHSGNLTNYKTKILNVSVWSDFDCNVFNEVKNYINKFEESQW
jgi:hypothetical protein